jgi:hypothetical protein
VINGYGNLHVVSRGEDGIRIVAARASGGVLDTLITNPPADLTLRYHSVGEGASVTFEFPLHDEIDNPWKISAEGRASDAQTLVVSDLHGRLDALAAVLRRVGVVDKNMNWTWGANRLIVLGDMLDRGRDDNGVAWLVYKLEKQALDSGGSVHLTPGNHEDLVLKNDLRYVHPDHLIFAERAAIPYAALYGPKTELGRWIRDKHPVLALGGNILVHAGLSTDMSDGDYTPAEMSERGRRWLGVPNTQRNAADARNEALFGTNGVLWYRGLVTASAPISSDKLDSVLDYYGGERIIVGHSEVDQVGLRYNGRVVAINVKHAVNLPANRSAGLLIDPGGVLWAVNYHGAKTLLAE